MELRLSPVQVHNRLILAARRIVAAHQPDAEGICPTCGVLHCEARAAALGYLARAEQSRHSPVVEMHRRGGTRGPGSPSAAVPPSSVAAAELRIVAGRVSPDAES